ncbi:restriction endonuclease subunit S [uncultured Brachyspira sp.]|uniref:restriction endonuclease subunit S n=1 Tax=uncultured Brachyspira sp. TaxID=221953 RepID=UPI00260A919B|nr:restriction endonuclease subunit S [uncultured Brachyspira sp.]
MYKGAIIMNHPLPRGWRELTLEEILSKEKHSIKRGPFGSDLKKDFFVKDGIKVFEQYNPINNDPHWCRYRITKEKYNQLSAFQCKAGDFLISCSGTLGKIILLPNNVEEGIINQALLKIRLNNDIIDNIYFLNLFQSRVFQNKIYGDARGGAIKNVASVDEIKKIEFILPPIDEQKRIAEVLSLCDKLIENLTKLIEKKEIYKKGVMQRVLSGEVRFNGFTDEWETVSISELVDKNIIYIEKGKAISKDKIIEGDIPVIAGGKTPAYYHNECTHDFPCITISASGTAGYVWFHDYKIWASDCNILYTDNKNYNVKFLYYYLLNIQKIIYGLKTGGVQPHVYAKDIINLTIPNISIEEQNKIAELLTLIDKDIDNLKQLLHLRKLQKKGLMQKLLTGEVRI